MSKSEVCHCNLPCKVIDTSQGRTLYKCGEDVCYKTQKRGCNFLLNDEEIKKFASQRYRLRECSFKDFPVCTQHNIKARIRIASSKSRNPGRVFFCCNVKAPDESCGFFQWIDDDRYSVSHPEKTLKRKKDATLEHKATPKKQRKISPKIGAKKFKKSLTHSDSE